MAAIDGRRLKIAVLVRHFVTTGGAERYAVEIARRLAERGHELHIFCREADAAVCRGMVVHLIPARYTFSSALCSLAFASDCASLLARHDFDVVHSHEKSYCQDLLTLHTFSYKGSLQRYGFWRRLDQRFLSYRSWVYLYLEKRQVATPRIVTVSMILREDAEQWLKQTTGVEVIEPGVDTIYFQPGGMEQQAELFRRELGVGDDEILVLFVGSEFKRKGLDRLINATGSGMHLAVVGRGDNLPLYVKMVRNRGLSEKIHFFGLAVDVRKYYAAADVVVLPSRIEAFGMTVLEGMACGLPVVVSSEVGAADVISNGRDGFVCADEKELVEVLAKLRDDPSLRMAVGAEARRTAERYTWESQSEKYERICYELVGARAAQ